MRENGELDTAVYARIKAERNAPKKQDVIPKEFPTRSEDLKYPPNALKIGSPLYMTTNMTYGGQQPCF